MPAGKSPLHSDAPKDIGVRGYCFFQVSPTEVVRSEDVGQRIQSRALHQRRGKRRFETKRRFWAVPSPSTRGGIPQYVAFPGTTP